MSGLNLGNGKSNNEEAGDKGDAPKTLTPSEPTKPPTEVDAKQPSADDGVVRFSSHPILRYKLGKWRFENGLLELRKKEDVDEFEKTLAQLPISERTRIKKLDLSAAEAQVRAVRDANPNASKAIGSETGNRDPGKQVGTGDLADSNEQ